MYIVIVGAGEVGSYVARILVGEGHDVAIVETDEDLAKRLDAQLNALVVHGSGVSPTTLVKAGVRRADLLLAVTSTDEVNLIACMTARKHGGKKLRAVARVRQSRAVAGEAMLSAEDLGLDALISPEQAITASVLEMLRYAGGGELRQLADGKLVLVGMVLGHDSPLVHETLAELRNDFPGDFLVAAVQGADGFRIPSGSDRLLVEERVFVLTLPQNLTELAILSGQPWHQAEKILIVGCGNTGLALARQLESRDLAPTIIERDLDRAEYVSGLLPTSLVVHGNASNTEFLRGRIEEGQIDTALVLLKDPEDSVLIGLFAKSLGARKVVVRCDEPGYVRLANKLGVDATVSPKRAMTDAILRYVRRGAVESTLLLGEHEAEVISFRIRERPSHSGILKHPLKHLPFPEGALVGAFIRDGIAQIASGDVILRAGDEVIVVTRPDLVGKLEKMLA